MCNHYRNDPEMQTTWREYIAWDLRKPNAEYATDVYPKRPAMIVRKDDGVIRSDVMEWGVPTMVKGKTKMLEKRVTNVRNLTSPFWRSMLNNPAQRCLVPFTTFAEPKIGQGREEWWFTIPDEPVSAFAGIWRQSQYGAVFAFLTCEPNELVAPLHPKAMPVVLSPSNYENWLSADYDEVCSLARACPANLMAVS